MKEMKMFIDAIVKSLLILISLALVKASQKIYSIVEDDKNEN